MTIGVKYCGGCNPKYERGEEVKKIQERHPEHIFESFDMSKDYEKVLLICGCERQCLLYRDELAKDNAVVVGSKEDCDKIDL